MRKVNPLSVNVYRVFAGIVRRDNAQKAG